MFACVGNPSKRRDPLLFGIIAILGMAVCSQVSLWGDDSETQRSSTGPGADPVLVGKNSDDLARRALGERSLPWYDAQQDSYRPLKPAKNAERNTEPSAPDSKGFPPWLVTVLMWTMLAVVVVLVVMAIARWLMDLTPPDSAPEPDKDSATFDSERLEALPNATHGVRDLLGEANRLAALGLFGEAMTFYFSWQLAMLDRQGSLELQKGKTNRQYQREIHQSRPDLGDVVTDSMRLFEDAFFGHLTVSDEDFQRVWEQRHRFDLPTKGIRR